MRCSLSILLLLACAGRLGAQEPLRASALVDAPLVVAAPRSGEDAPPVELGRVLDVVIERLTGTVLYVAVAPDAALGVRDRLLPITLDRVRPVGGGFELLRASRAMLAAAPAFTADAWPAGEGPDTDRLRVAAIWRHWQREPTWSVEQPPEEFEAPVREGVEAPPPPKPWTPIAWASVRASQLSGTRVFAPGDLAAGRIVDLVLEMRDGRVQAAVLELEAGPRVLLRWEQLRCPAGEYLVDLDAAALAALPQAD